MISIGDLIIYEQIVGYVISEYNDYFYVKYVNKKDRNKVYIDSGLATCYTPTTNWDNNELCLLKNRLKEDVKNGRCKHIKRK